MLTVATRYWLGTLDTANGQLGYPDTTTKLSQ